MAPELRHAGKAVLVTGGASGIGLGIVLRFLRDGARVASVDLRDTKVDSDSDGRLLSLIADVTDEEAVDKVVKDAVGAFGRLDVVVCNAGVIGVKPVVDMEFREWRRVTETNLHSVFLTARAGARQMLAQQQGDGDDRGVIITAASGAGRRGAANLSHYCASKAAIISLTQSLAIELAPRGIRVNSYAPGHIETPFWGDIAGGFAALTGETPEAVVERLRSTVPAGRFGTAEDVAGAVSWLATPEAGYISGQAIAMNGAEMPY